MLISVHDALHHCASAVKRMNARDRALLGRDSLFDTCLGFDQSNVALDIFEITRHLFEKSYLVAMQVDSVDATAIGSFGWECTETAYQILTAGKFTHSNMYTKMYEPEKSEIVVFANSATEPELAIYLGLAARTIVPNYREGEAFSRTMPVQGAFQPTDPGIPKGTIPISTAFFTYNEERWKAHPSIRQMQAAIQQFISTKLTLSKFGCDQIIDIEICRRRHIASVEFHLAIEEGNLSAYVRSKNEAMPVRILPQFWRFSESYEGVLKHSTINAAPDDNLRFYNGGMAFVDKDEFSAWLNSNKKEATPLSPPSSAKRGRKPGSKFYMCDDEHVRKIREILDRGEAASFAGAFRLISHLVKGVSYDSKEKRLRRVYNEKYPDINGQ